MTVLPEIPTWAAMAESSPYFHVVRDMDEVVDFHAPPDERPAERPAVNRRVRSDLHVVFHHHDSHVTDLDELPLAAREPEAVRAEDRARVDHHPASDSAAFADRDVRPENSVLADRRSRTEKDARVKDGSSADRRTLSHRRKWVHRDIRRDLRGGRHEGARVDPRRVARARVKEIHERG